MNHPIDPANSAAAPHPENDGGKTPIDTKPLDENERGAWFDEHDEITALRIYDGVNEYKLPEKPFITLGASSACDIVIGVPSVSALHCVLERRGRRLRCRDQNSTNGTWTSTGRRVDTVDLDPGDTITVGPVTLLAMNREMVEHRPTFVDLMGMGSHPSPDALLVSSTQRNFPLLLVGRTGCESDMLARAMHGVSLRRRLPLVTMGDVPPDRAAQRELLKRARRSTLVLDLTQVEGPLDEAFCELLFSVEFQIHVIVLVTGTNMAQGLLPRQCVEVLQRVVIPLLATRPGDILALLDRMLESMACPRRASDITQANRDALRAWAWPSNFSELRSTAERLNAIARVPEWSTWSWEKRATSTGFPQTTLYKWFDRMSLSDPLFE